MSAAEQLLELQLTDSAIDLLRNRLPRLPEVIASAAAQAEVEAWEKRRRSLREEIDSFEAAIATAEQASAQISTKRARLETQLKTIISPREAEALMHEIATLNAQRSALDDDELEAMEGLSHTEGELAEHDAAEARVRDAAAAAAESAAMATDAVRTELAELTATSEARRAEIDPALLRRYDAMRAQLGGVAIAKLNNLRCEGCHIDMSRAEADDIKRLPADEMPECPNCGRLLAR
jgi:predicted  nucleic acid-binding Zn-ribbon protein